MSLAAVAIGAFYVANLWFFWKFSQLGVEMKLEPNHVFFQFISAQKTQLSFTYAIVSVVVFTILALGGLFLSHRVAGPLYRLCSHFDEFNKGKDVGPVSFRKGDFFLEVPEHVNPVFMKRREEEAAKKENSDEKDSMAS